MPPLLALFLTISISCYLLYDDWKNNPIVSNSLLIPLAYMMIAGSRMVSLWFPTAGVEMSADAYLEGSPFDRDVFIVLFVAAGVILARRQVKWKEVLTKNKWIAVFVVYSFISIIAWSEFPAVSFKRWAKLIGSLLMVLVVLTEEDPIEAIKALGRRCAFVLIPMSLTLYKYFPGLGRVYHRYTGSLSIAGVATNKNSLGALCMISGLLLFWILWTGRGRYKDKYGFSKFIILFFIFPITLWLIYMARSATALICFIIGIFILFLMETRITKENKRSIGLMAIVSIIVFFGFEYVFNVVEVATKLLGRDLTFTGRTEVWETLLGMVKEPVFGFGYGSFWLGERLEKLWEMYMFLPNEAHNGYIETYLESGIVGLIILGCILISGFRNILRGGDVNLSLMTIRFTLFVVSIIYNITESAFRPGILLFFIFNLAIIEIPQKIKRRGFHDLMKVEHDKTF